MAVWESKIRDYLGVSSPYMFPDLCKKIRLVGFCQNMLISHHPFCWYFLFVKCSQTKALWHWRVLGWVLGVRELPLLDQKFQRFSGFFAWNALGACGQPLNVGGPRVSEGISVTKPCNTKTKPPCPPAQ